MTDTATRPEDEVVRICQELIRIDTSNYGDGSGPGEAAAAAYVVDLLREVGLEPQTFESDPGRVSVAVRSPAPTATAARCACTVTWTSCPPTPPTGRSTRSRGRSATGACGAAVRST